MTALFQQLKNDVGKLLSNLSAEVQENYENMFEAVKLNVQTDLVEGCTKMESHFHVESIRLSVSAGNELLLRFFEKHSSPVKSTSLSSAQVSNSLDVGSSSSKSLFLPALKARKPGRASGSKSGKKAAEGPSSGAENIDVD